MAKYSRFDSRNKKRNRHKNQYLDRGSMGRKNRERLEGDLYHQEVYDKYGIEFALKKY
jgi:hypothetical protein